MFIAHGAARGAHSSFCSKLPCAILTTLSMYGAGAGRQGQELPGWLHEAAAVRADKPSLG